MYNDFAWTHNPLSHVRHEMGVVCLLSYQVSYASALRQTFKRTISLNLISFTNLSCHHQRMPYSNRPLLWLLSTIVKQLLLFFADLAPIFANSPTAWMVERLWTRSDKKLCMLWKNWAINYSLLDSFFFKNDTACFINLVIYGLHLGFMKQICEKHQQPFQKMLFDVFHGEYDELS